MRVVVALEHSTCRQHSCTNLPAAGWSQACHRTAHAGTVTPQDSGVVKLMRCDPRLGSTRQARHCRCDGAGHWSRSADRTQRLGPRQHEPSANALLPDRTRPSQPPHRASSPRRQARHTMCTAWRPRVCRPLFHLLLPSHRTTPRFAHLCHHHPRTILANASALSQPSLRKRLNLSRRGREPSATAGGERRLRTGRTCRRSG